MGVERRKKNQCMKCWKIRVPKDFIGDDGLPRKHCRICRKRRGKRRPPRRGLSPTSELRVGWNPMSRNRKLGPIPVALVSSSTCPPSCSFHGNGCYAEFHVLRWHWVLAERSGLEWLEFCQTVAQLPHGQLWRYAEAGDLPGRGDRIDPGLFMMLAIANELAGARGFTFTHKPLRTALERGLVWTANRRGFTINLSAEGLEDADRKADLRIGPVAAVVPSHLERGTRTPAGRHVVLCPAETHGLTCSECELCAQPQRKSIVAFRAHGQMRTTVSQLVQLRRSA
jgi:hypothetical protein